VVSGHAQLIREAGDGSSLNAHADVITRQCGRMEQIVRQLLDFARSQAAPSDESVELDRAVEDALGLLRPLARRSDVELKVSVEPGLRARIGHEQLQQLLVNLVVNAVQATPEGGPVEVRLGRGVAAHPAERSEPAEYAVISVRDYGVGMAPDTIERIFEPFFTTKRVGEGTGLGLAVAYGIVQEQRGWIDVSSAPRSGSCFTVHLPLEPV
jgi:two-component system cell cycle sensor histidine kinase/response regulator CckA